MPHPHTPSFCTATSRSALTASSPTPIVHATESPTMLTRRGGSGAGSVVPAAAPSTVVAVVVVAVVTVVAVAAVVVGSSSVGAPAGPMLDALTDTAPVVDATIA